MKAAWTATVAMTLSLVCTEAGAQSLVDAAKRAEEHRKTSTTEAIAFDERDVNPRAAAHEILSYDVNDARWKKFLAANQRIDKAMARDAALRDRFQMLKPTGARMIERFVLREPALLEAIERSGTDAHEYAYTAVAIGFALAIIASDPGPEVYDQLPEATKANVTFVRGREQEIRELFVYAHQKAAERGH